MASYPDFDELIQSSESHDAPLILLMGPPRAGKTSILRVLFGKLSPHDTSFLEPTTTPCGIVYPSQTTTSSKEALLKCRIIDLPGSQQFYKQHHALITKLLGVAACIVFVIDASADTTWGEATTSLISLLSTMESLDLQRHVAVLLHKIDGESYMNEMRIQYTDLRRNLLDALRSNTIKLPVTFYVTSLYDVTIFESFSRIFQQIIPQTNLLGNLLDGFITACGIEKVFIVDTNSKLYLATDSTVPDVTLYQLLGDMLDLVFDIGFVYSPNQDYDEDDEEGPNNNTNNNNNNNNPTSDTVMAMNELKQYGASSLPQSTQLSTNNNNNNNNTTANNTNEADLEADFDCYSAEISLHNGISLFLRQLNGHLSLLFSLRPENSTTNSITNRKGTIEYNITCLKQAIAQIFNIQIYGIQSRPQVFNQNTSNNGANNEYGIHHYMGSYASQSAIANLKSYYSSIGGQSLQQKSYIGPSSLAQPNKFGAHQPLVGSSRATSNFDTNNATNNIPPTGSMPNQRR